MDHIRDVLLATLEDWEGDPDDVLRSFPLRLGDVRALRDRDADRDFVRCEECGAEAVADVTMFDGSTPVLSLTHGADGTHGLAVSAQA